MKHEAGTVKHHSNPFCIPITIHSSISDLNILHEPLTRSIVEFTADSKIVKVVSSFEVSGRRAQALHVLRARSPSPLASEIIRYGALGRGVFPVRVYRQIRQRTRGVQTTSRFGWYQEVRRKVVRVFSTVAEPEDNKVSYYPAAVEY